MKRKIIPYILIIITLIGLFGLAVKASAQTEPKGRCTVTDATRKVIFQGETTEAECKAKKIPGVNVAVWDTSATYHLLAPLPCENNKDTQGCNTDAKELETFDTGNLSVYLNLMIKIFIGLCAVLSVVMIVVGGLEYMTSELISNKEHGKDRIRDALFGLVIALGAYALLFTINPDLLKSDVKVSPATIVIPPGSGENCSDHEFTTQEECEAAGHIWTVVVP